MKTRTALGKTACFWAILLFAFPTAFAQKQYEGIRFAPYEFYEAMISYCNEKKWKELSRALPPLKPLFGHIQKESGLDFESEIQEAIAKGNVSEVHGAVLRLIAEDLRLHLKAAGASNTATERKEKIQMAYINYTFLSPFIASEDPGRDHALREAFKEIYRAKDRDAVSRKIEWLMTQLTLIFSVVNSDENKTFP